MWIPFVQIGKETHNFFFLYIPIVLSFLFCVFFFSIILLPPFAFPFLVSYSPEGLQPNFSLCSDSSFNLHLLLFPRVFAHIYQKWNAIYFMLNQLEVKELNHGTHESKMLCFPIGITLGATHLQLLKWPSGLNWPLSSEIYGDCQTIMQNKKWQG